MSNTQTNTIYDAFALKHFIRINSVGVPENPHRDNTTKWDADHWFVTLSFANGIKRKFTVYFSKEIGLRKKYTFQREGRPIPPTISELLECLQSDCSEIEKDFEEWANEYGYDSDSIKAERIYTTIRTQRAQLKAFLGHAAYTEFLSLDSEGN